MSPWTTISLRFLTRQPSFIHYLHWCVHIHCLLDGITKHAINSSENILSFDVNYTHLIVVMSFDTSLTRSSLSGHISPAGPWLRTEKAIIISCGWKIADPTENVFVHIHVVCVLQLSTASAKFSILFDCWYFVVYSACLLSYCFLIAFGEHCLD